MEKRGIAVFVLVIFSIFMINFASAEVFFSQQPKDSYALGEQIKVVLGSDGTPGWVNVALKCGSTNSSSGTMVFFHYVTKEETSLPISVPLTKDFLRDMQGDCYFSMVSNSVTKESLHFEISSELKVAFSFNKQIYSPNENVFFTGTVVKKNGGKVENGFAEIKFPYSGIESIVPVKNGEFKGNLSLQENIPAGDYLLDIFVYEKDDKGDVTNFFLANYLISILSEPRNLEVQFDSEGKAGGDLGFTAFIYDQASSIINDLPVAFTMLNPSGDQVLSVLSKTGTITYYKFKKNAPIGNWNLSAQAGTLDSGIIGIYIGENVEAEFLMINNTLIVRNVGNLPYDKFVQVRIGENYTRVLALNLSLGSSVEFELEAPDGEYEVLVDDGKANINAIALLTGNAIGIKDSSSGGIGFLNKYVFSWIIIIGILGLFVFVSARKVVNRKSVLFSKNINFGEKKKSLGGVVKVDEKTNKETKVNIREGPKSGIVPISNFSLDNTASSSLVVQGSRQKATLLSLNIKDNNLIKQKDSNVNEIINDAIEYISKSKGKVYRSGHHVIGIFAPAITKTFDNNMEAIKVADAITNKLKDYNKKYSKKIDFGIGINSGDIIADTRGGKFLFTPLGNSVQLAKKISDIAQNDLLLSDETNKALAGKFKTIANNSGGMKTYAVNDVIDKTQHAQFINRFLDRNYKKLGDFKI